MEVASPPHVGKTLVLNNLVPFVLWQQLNCLENTLRVLGLSSDKRSKLLHALGPTGGAVPA